MFLHKIRNIERSISTYLNFFLLTILLVFVNGCTTTETIRLYVPINIPKEILTPSEPKFESYKVGLKIDVRHLLYFYYSSRIALETNVKKLEYINRYVDTYNKHIKEG